ncbi:MAG: PD-(D/E)XK motif protein [Bacteroidia bacterium]|nr:PD-(D/E)XK motif protein [Bacteroidia bacterium]
MLEKAFLTDEVFRLLVIRQEGVDQVDWKWLACGHVVSLWGRLSTTDRLHKIFYTPEGEFELSFRLVDSAQVEIFKALCANLMSATKRLQRDQYRVGLETTISRLARWQELLRSRMADTLTQSQIIGLWGELLFFRDLFLSHLPPHVALSSWRGPFGDEQDFILGSKLIEIKTQLNSSDRKIQISSAEQLDTVSGQIILCHQIIGPAANEDPQGMSLNELVENVTARMGKDTAALDVYCSILIEFGYMKKNEYDVDKWVLNERRYYLVEEEFPAIKASELLSGITDVKYCIKTEAISGFLVAEDQFSDSVFGQDLSG